VPKNSFPQTLTDLVQMILEALEASHDLHIPFNWGWVKSAFVHGQQCQTSPNVANSCLNVVARKDVESDVNARRLSCHAQPSVFVMGIVVLMHYIKVI